MFYLSTESAILMLSLSKKLLIMSSKSSDEKILFSVLKILENDGYV